MARRKKPAGGSKPVEKAAPKFWTPPSVRKGGGAKPAARAARDDKPAPKFWTPEAFGLNERPARRQTDDRRVLHTVGGVTYSWSLPDGRTPRGLTVVGLKGHEERVTVIYPGNCRQYDDPVLSELDPYRPDGSGWCAGCASDRCSGVLWALHKLRQKNRVPF